MAPTLAAHLQLKHLRLIAAIAEHRQLSIAAQALAMTQPAASRTLAEAEARVGAALFTRHPKGMMLTAIGESLARRARNIMDELNDASDEVERLRQGRGGVVRVGAVTGAAVGYLVPAIRRIRQVAPEVELHVDVGTSEDLMAGLAASRHDMVLGRLPAHMAPDGLILHRARGETVDIVAAAGHPAAGRRDLALTDLAGQDWVMQGPGAPIRRAVDEAFLAQGVAPPRSIINTASLLMVLALLRDPGTVTAVSHEVALLLTEGRRDLAILSVAEPILVAPYALILQRDRRLSPVAARFRDLLVGLIA